MVATSAATNGPLSVSFAKSCSSSISSVSDSGTAARWLGRAGESEEEETSFWDRFPVHVDDADRLGDQGHHGTKCRGGWASRSRRDAKLVERKTLRDGPIIARRQNALTPARPEVRLGSGPVVDERPAVEQQTDCAQGESALVVAGDRERDRLADVVSQLVRRDRERRGARSGPRRGEQSDDEGEKEFFSWPPPALPIGHRTPSEHARGEVAAQVIGKNGESGLIGGVVGCRHVARAKRTLAATGAPQSTSRRWVAPGLRARGNGSGAWAKRSAHETAQALGAFRGSSIDRVSTR